jgi:hypothetical protein
VTRAPPAPKPLPPIAGGIDLRPKATDTPLLLKTRTVDDLTVTDLNLDTGASRLCLFWSEDAKSFYHLSAAGVVRRIGVAGMTEELRLETAHKCSWLSHSSDGLVLTVADLQEIWVLDPVTLEVRNRFAVPDVTRVAASPKSPLVFAVARGDWVRTIDLKKRQIIDENRADNFEYKQIGFEMPVLSPDGNYLFTFSRGKVHHFKVGDDKLLKWEEASIGDVSGQIQGIDLSYDGSLVCLASSRGNSNRDKYPDAGPNSTFVYASKTLSEPAVILKSGAYPQAVGFDPNAKLIYAQNRTKDLIIYSLDGVSQKEYVLGRGYVTRFLVHPDGRKLIAVGDKFCYVELPKP